MTPIASNIVVTAIDIVPLIMGGVTYRFHDRGMRILFYFFFVILIFNLINIALKLSGQNNLWVLHVYTLVEYVFIVIAVATWLDRGLRPYAFASIALFVAVWTGLKLYVESLQQFDNLSFGIESFLLMTVSVVVLVRLMDASDSLLHDHRFYAVLGILMYFAGTITLFALRSILYSWPMHSAVAFLASLFWTRAFWCLRCTPKSTSY